MARASARRLHARVVEPYPAVEVYPERVLEIPAPRALRLLALRPAPFPRRRLGGPHRSSSSLATGETDVHPDRATKGGVGKSTTTVAVAENLASRGNDVLVIDADYQTNSTVALIGNTQWDGLNNQKLTTVALLEDAINEGSPGYVRQFDSQTHIFTGASNIAGALSGQIDLLPSSPDVVRAKKNLYLAGKKSQYGSVSRLNFLDWALRDTLPNYDYVLIDTHPDLDDMLYASLYISDYYLMPVIPDAVSTYGIVTMETEVSRFSTEIRRNIKKAGVLISMYREINPHRKYVGLISARPNADVFRTKIPLRANMTDALDFDKNVSTLKMKYGYDTNGIAREYEELTTEVVNRCQ